MYSHVCVYSFREWPQILPVSSEVEIKLFSKAGNVSTILHLELMPFRELFFATGFIPRQ